MTGNFFIDGFLFIGAVTCLGAIVYRLLIRITEKES